MKRSMILSLMVLLLCAARGVAQSSGEVNDIRKVDFLNFSYPSSLCSQEYGEDGIGKVVSVRDGEFKNESVYFAFAGDTIVYADMTGDGREEAVVPIDCGAIGANFSRSEVYVYTIQGGSPTLLAELGDDDLERDYRLHYPDAESYWGVKDNGLKVKDGRLEVDVLAEGPHASPRYIVTLEYRLSGEALGLIGKPQRKRVGR